MKHLFYDDASDKALIATLQTINAEKAAVVAALQSENEALRKKVVELLTSPQKIAVPQKVLTKEDVATKLGLPLWAVDQIDWGRLGTQFNDVDFGKK